MATKKKSKFNIVSVLNGLLIVLVLFSLIIDGLFVYYKFFNKDITIGIYNIGEQIAVDDASVMSDEELAIHNARTLFTVNLYSNDRGNGAELQELNINYFSDYRLLKSAYRSTGMQYLGNFETYTTQSTSEHNTNNKVLNEFTYYDTTNGISWNGYNGEYGSVATVLNRNQQIIISIDGEAYAIQLNGKKENKGRILFWDATINTLYYDYGDLFACVMQAVKSNSRGYGDGFITLDLSQFFTIRKYDESGKFIADDVTNVIKEYAEIRFHYDRNGAKQANQSLFGSIQNNNAYGLTDEEKNVEYWSENIIQTIDLNALSLRHSEVNNGYFASLNTAIKNKLKENEKIKLDIVLDLTNTNKNIIGLDYDAFKNVSIRTMVIVGSGEFILNTGSLVGTGVKELIHSSNLILDIKPDAINNDYLEVIV